MFCIVLNCQDILNLIPLYLCILIVIAFVAQVSDVVPGPLVTYTIYCLWIIVDGGGLLCRLILCYDPLMTSSTVHIVHCYKYRLLLFLIFSIHLLKRFRFGDDDKSKLCMVNQCSLFRSKNIFFQFQTSILAISLLKNLSPCPF